MLFPDLDEGARGRWELEPVLGGRWIVGLLQLLLGMPLLVVAWLEPRQDDEPGLPARRSLAGLLPVLAVPALAIVWLLAIGTLPVRASRVQVDFMHGSMQGASCGHFFASREVAWLRSPDPSRRAASNAPSARMLT